MALFHAGVFFSVVYFFRVERWTAAALKYFWVWLFLVSEFLSTPASQLPNWGRYFSNKPISGAWQNVKLKMKGSHASYSCGFGACEFVCIQLASVLLEKFGVFALNSSSNIVLDAIHRGTKPGISGFSVFVFFFQFALAPSGGARGKL